MAHDLHFGGRWHYDEIRRFQRNDIASQDDTGAIVDFDRGLGGSGGNRLQESKAIALWLQDDIQLGNVTVTPGIRYEYIDQHHTDYESDPSNTVRGRFDGSLDVFLPGISVQWDISDTDMVFAGVHKGFSIPGPRAVQRSGTDEEESIGYELGFRTRRDTFNAELIGFYTDFDNLIGSDTG
ncbi:MAG: TonB-dependent receptor, partial [Verrucomicrobiota bacterium]